MQIFHNLDEWILFRRTLSADCSLGFAPTMGNLHAGHTSLFVASQKENHYTASSLFVNPTQFNQRDDFTHYPRTLDADLQIMNESGVDFCILPDEQAIYPDAYAYQIHETALSQVLEGTYRPGHFNGVLTVVMKLLHLVKPAKAYFGEKDFQQYQLIRQMVDAFFMDVDVIACPIIREPSGLAYSSRNNRLNQEQRKLAEKFACIFQQKNTSCALIVEQLTAQKIDVEYIQEFEGRRYAAVRIGDIRLIDNYLLTS